jgi:glycosyltransferase involved in cell wall biosynthesis
VNVHAGVTIVVCCLNSAGRLRRPLRALADQVPPVDAGWEVLVVDNASTDDTADAAMRIWSEFGAPVELRTVREPEPGLSWARRRGITESRFDYVVFCDDDNLLDPTYTAHAFNVMQTYPEVGAAGGQSIPCADVPLPAWFYTHAESYAVGVQALESRDVSETRAYLWGAGLVVRAAPLRRLYDRGWTPLLVDRRGANLAAGGDAELCKWFLAGGWRLRYDEGLRLTHVIAPERLDLAYLDAQGAGFVAAHPVLRAYDRCLRRDRLRRTSPLSADRLKAELAVLLESRAFSRRWRRLRQDLASAEPAQ